MYRSIILGLIGAVVLLMAIEGHTAPPSSLELLGSYSWLPQNLVVPRKAL